MAETFDVTFWAQQPDFTLIRASFLIRNRAPIPPRWNQGIPYFPKDTTEDVIQVSERLKAEVPHRKAYGERKVWNGEWGGTRSGNYITRYEREWIFEREDLRAWCEANELRPLFLFPVEPTLAMQAQAAANEHFWRDWTPGDRRPSKDAVMDWVLANFPELSQNKARIVDEMIRPETAQKGGKHRQT